MSWNTNFPPKYLSQGETSPPQVVITDSCRHVSIHLSTRIQDTNDDFHKKDLEDSLLWCSNPRILELSFLLCPDSKLIFTQRKKRIHKLRRADLSDVMDRNPLYILQTKMLKGVEM